MALTKAQALRLLAASESLTFAIDPFVSFSVEEWQRSQTGVLARIQQADLGPVVVVRSSAVMEDAARDVPPGLFHSVLDVSSSDSVALAAAIRCVIRSFARHPQSRGHELANEIIVQRQLATATMSGVVSTGTSDDLYLTVHYDDESGQTNRVTAGGSCKRAEVLRETPLLPEPWHALRAAVVSVTAILHPPLLIEFGISPEGRVHVFQARRNWQLVSGEADRPSLSLSLPLLESARAQLAARGGLWSDMTDWNPAELLGDRPKPLPLTLYQYLVTNEAWIRGRASLGYRDIIPSILVETFAGKPYVNVARSFLSLTPASLEEGLANRLVADRLLALREQPHLHDKVELELLFSAADPITPGRTNCLLGRGFSRREVDQLDAQLRILTSSALTRQQSLQEKDAAIVSRLVSWSTQHRADSGEHRLSRLLAFVREALTRCRDEGVVPFARHARLAFIARDLLGRLSAGGCIEPDWLQQWWMSLDTIAQGVGRAIAEVADGRLPRSAFDAQFGHLRARTFDVCSPRYDRVDRLPVPSATGHILGNVPALGFRERQAIENSFGAAGLEFSVDEFFMVARGALRAREELKFGFSSVLSDALEAIAAAGEVLGFSRNDLVYISLEEIIAADSQGQSEGDIRRRWQEVARSGREQWLAGCRVALPDLLVGPDDILVVRRRIARPNFVTGTTVTGDVVVLQQASPDTPSVLTGRIVVVEAADPGCDWIFAMGIAGLITRYGGAGSHMAIRCAEFGIPAAIGCGDEIYQSVIRASRVRLDCAEGRIEVISRETNG